MNRPAWHPAGQKPTLLIELHAPFVRAKPFSQSGNQCPLVIVQMGMNIATRNSRHRLIAILAALSLGIAACGSGETVDAGANGTTNEESTNETLPGDATGEDVTPEPTGDVTEGYTPMAPRSDLVSLETATPDEVIVDPNDDTRLLIHFEGAAEPCAGAAVTIEETDTDVTVMLETGLDPNAAAMSCIAQAFQFEIAVQLDAPLGERAIVTG